ncbi:MAG TPA: hypothetical protein VLC10_00715 [Patescibacteria group bacterium]|nr:hypothetical protein [Patescibacteria group bacterium]
MKKFLRLLALAAVAVGAVMLGYAVSEGFRRGFGFDLDYGNWDPVLIGAAGAALLAAGAFAHAYFGHPEAGVRRRKAFLATLRRAAVWTLVLAQHAGLAGGVYGFIMCVALSHAGQECLWALGLVGCGAVAFLSAGALLPWARGPRPAPKETSVARFDDDE